MKHPKEKLLVWSALLIMSLTFPNKAFPQYNGSTITNPQNSIRDLYHIRDTISSDNTSITLVVEWMDSVIEIRKTTSLKYDLSYIRKFRKDPTYVPSGQDTLSYNAMRKTGSQNCHSYALERYFNYYQIKDNTLFTGMTIVTENKYMQIILASVFKKGDVVTTKPGKNLKFAFAKGSLLVFRNKGNTPIHSVFYDGAFHSKYGAWAAETEKELKPVFKRYWDTETIEAYQIDWEKVKKYISEKDAKGF